MSTNLGGASCFGFGLTQMQPAAVRLRLPPARAADTSSSQSPARLTAVLEQVDQLLSQGNDMAALSLVRSTQGGDGGLRAFGAARQHEAGHFLIAYLLGVLPKGYTITSLDTLMNQGSLNVQAGAAFVDYEFL
uniref:Uncharacterized protein n=1 Tax=Zea mays TaxID=4577 RepID=A0A804N3I6_MAIZE